MATGATPVPSTSGKVDADAFEILRRVAGLAGGQVGFRMFRGDQTHLDITAATVVQATPGRIVRVSVITAGSTAGTVNDCAATGAAAVGNQVASIPNTVGVYEIDMPCAVGIVVVPGTGQVLAVSYS